MMTTVDMIDTMDINDMMDIDEEPVSSIEELKNHQRIFKNKLYYEANKANRREKYKIETDSINSKIRARYNEDEAYRLKRLNINRQYTEVKRAKLRAEPVI